MAEKSRPAKRMKYALRGTFDVVVGQAPAQRFTVYTDVLTERSKFLRATRKPEWLKGDASKPVDLSDEDPDVFQSYLNCVYFGPETLHTYTDELKRQMSSIKVMLHVLFAKSTRHETAVTDAFEDFDGFKSVHPQLPQAPPEFYYVEFTNTECAIKARASRNMHVIDGFELIIHEPQCPINRRTEAGAIRDELADTGFGALIRLYLLADKLQDLVTANQTIDALIRLAAETDEIPRHVHVSLAYNSTTSTSPLRTLLRDYWTYEFPRNGQSLTEEDEYPKELLRDITAEFMRGRQECWEGQTPHECLDPCEYHQHDDKVPRCST